MYYTRALEDVWLETSEQFPVLLLTGPRQVGKTTMLERLCTPDRSDPPHHNAIAGTKSRTRTFC